MKVRSRVFVVLLLGGTMLGGVARAQEQSLASAPPPKIPVDAHGVNVVTGAYNTSQSLLTIGQPGAGGLSVSRQFDGSGWRESYIGTINTIDNANYTVSVGGITEVFARSGNTYANELGGPSTLTYDTSTLIYTYTLSDGTVLLFGPASPVGYQTGPWQANAGRLNKVTFPTGEVDTYAYSPLQFCSGNTQVAQGGTNAAGKSTEAASTSNGGAQPNVGGNGSCTNVTRLNTITSNTGYQVALQYTDGGAGAPQNVPHFTVSEFDGSNTVTGSGTVVSTQIGQNSTQDSTDDGLVSRLYTYTGLGLITTVQVGTSPATTINLTYDSSNRVATYNDNYYTYQYAYSDNGAIRTTTMTGPTGTKVYVSNTTTSLVSSFTDELNRTTSYTYDSSTRLQQVSYPEGDYTTYGYDARGNVASVTKVAKPGSGLANIVTQASYDATCIILVKCDKPNYTLDAKGFETDYTYDPTHGGVTSVTLPAPANGAVAPQTRYTYTALSAPTGGGSIYRLTATSACATTSSCTGGSDEVKSTIAYGTNLLPTSMTSGSGDGVTSATNALSWSSAGDLVSVDGPLAGTADTTVLFYGAAHQILGAVGPDPDGAGPLAYRATRYTYDARGLVTSVEKGTVASQSASDFANFSSLLQQTSSYNNAGLKVTDTLVQGGAIQTLTQYSYNTRALPQCVATRDPAYASSLPAGACTTTGSTAPGADRINQTAYDAAGQVTATFEGVGSADAATTAAYTYGSDGEQVTALDANNNLTTFVRDGFNRIGTIEFPMPGSPAGSSFTGTGTSQTAAAGIESYGYDANSNRTTLTRRGGQAVTYGYDNLNRMTAANETVTNGYANYSYGYDNLNRLTSTASSQGYSHGFTYDALNRKTGEATPFGTVASQYDAGGRRTRLTWPDGFYVAYVYDTVGEMTAIEENGATSGPGLLATLSYDNLGRRAGLTHGDGVATSYGYDAASRLSSISHSLPNSAQSQTETYAYNLANQVVSKTSSNDGWAWTNAYNFNRSYTANGLNELTTSGASTLTYGAKGVLTTDQAGMTYSYDTNNQLFQASNGSVQMYDGGGRLYAVGQSGATRFAYDGDLAIAEYNSSGTVLRRYVPGPGQDEPLVWYEGSGTATRYGLTADRLGSITGVVADNGSLSAINAYDEYGLPGTSNAGRYQYTGQKYLSEYGMYDYKTRVYSPTLGRFVQPDSIGYSDGLNIYQYVGSDPLNSVDSLGLAGNCAPASAAGAGIQEIIVCGTRPAPEVVSVSNLSGGDFIQGTRLQIDFEPPPPQSTKPYPYPGKISCSSRLPNGETVGQVVQDITDNINARAALGEDRLGLFVSAALPNGPEDFKNIFGHDSTGYLGAAGNFAYGAVAAGSGISQNTAQIGAGAYAVAAGKPNFSNPDFEDSSAAKFLPAGYATGGCP